MFQLFLFAVIICLIKNRIMLGLLFIGYILSIGLSFYFYYKRKKLSISIAEEYINDNINKFIIEAQLNYSGSDNIRLISEWIKAIDQEKLTEFEKELFNVFLENAKQ